MVFTRRMDKKGVNNAVNENSKIKVDKKSSNSSNSDSEECLEEEDIYSSPYLSRSEEDDTDKDETYQPNIGPNNFESMVFTRRMDKKGVNNAVNENSKMKVNKKSSNSSNGDSEDEQNTLPIPSVPSGSSGSSIKVTLKKTRSCSSSSSRESAQSFEVVRNVPPASESISESEDGKNQNESEHENISNNQNSDDVAENEKESEEESQNANTSDDDDDEIEILSDDSNESLNVRPLSTAVKNETKVEINEEKKDDKNLVLNTEIDLKTEEVPQNSTAVKKEDCKIKVKSLKEELLKEVDAENDVVVLQDDDDDDDNTSSISQPQNGIEKKDIKKQKFKVNVRSFDDLVAPRSVNLINMHPPSGQIDGQSNFISQNGVPFSPQFMNLSCDICGIQFDSSELLNEHKIAMKHYKCSFNKECEILVISSQEELLDHQRMVHNIMPSPVQQLAHQVQRIPAMGFDQQLQSGVQSMPDNLPLQSSMPNMYTQTLRMPNQPIPMQRAMRPMMRQPMPPHMVSSRGRNVQRASRGRPPVAMNCNMTRGGSVKRPTSMPIRNTPPLKRVTTDRNSFTNNINKPSPIVKSLTESLTKSLTSVNNKPSSTNQTKLDVVNLFSKRGLTISTVDTVNNISIPAGLSLNSAVSIIPTSPHKVHNNVPSKSSIEVPSVQHKTSNHIYKKNVDTVDLTGSDNPRLWPCEICSKTYQSIELLYEHIAFAHKSVVLPFKCSSCPRKFPNSDILNRHKQSYHKSETNSNNASFVIPILDLSKAGTTARLQAMGITNYLPIAQLDNQGGHYGLPIMNTARPGSVDGLKYSHFFSLGCIRKI